MSHKVDQRDHDQHVPYGPDKPIEEHVPYRVGKLSLGEQHVPCQSNQPMEEEYFPHQVDQPLKGKIVYSQADRVRGSCSGLERGGLSAKNLDASTIEELEDHIPACTI